MQRNWIGKSTGALVRFSLTPALSKGEGDREVLSFGEDLGEVRDKKGLSFEEDLGEAGDKEVLSFGEDLGEAVGYYGYETADPILWKILKDNSQSNRKNPTEAENILWQALRNSQTGFKIRRQHAIDAI